MNRNKKRILVVDDELSITRLLKLNLEETDEYEVRAEPQRYADSFGKDRLASLPPGSISD